MNLCKMCEKPFYNEELSEKCAQCEKKEGCLIIEEVCADCLKHLHAMLDIRTTLLKMNLLNSPLNRRPPFRAN